LERETEDAAIYIHTSRPGVSQLTGPHHEKQIDSRYLDRSCRNKSYRLETYRSLGTVSSAHPTQLRCYFVGRCDFVKPDPTEEVILFLLLKKSNSTRFYELTDT
jgi:glutamate dehydrogenase